MGHDAVTLDMEFSGDVWYWRGPAPHYFVTVPADESAEVRAISGLVTYGWGMIPATVRIGRTAFDTSLFARNGGYVVPIKGNGS